MSGGIVELVPLVQGRRRILGDVDDTTPRASMIWMINDWDGGWRAFGGSVVFCSL